MFSGLLEEAFGAEQTESILDSAFGVDETPSHLSELIKTEVSIPDDKVTTTPPASAKSPAPRRVEVPVTIRSKSTAPNRKLSSS